MYWLIKINEALAQAPGQISQKKLSRFVTIILRVNKKITMKKLIKNLAFGICFKLLKDKYIQRNWCKELGRNPETEGS